MPFEQAAGARLGRVWQHMQERSVGMMSANRGEFTAAENRLRNGRLESDLKAAGLGFIKVKGRYVENKGSDNERTVDENSYFVTGPEGDDKGLVRGTIKKLGKKYEQDSVLYKDFSADNALLLGIGGGYPGAGKTVAVGKFKPNRADEFHSMLRGHTFSFANLEMSFVEPVSFFSRPEPEEQANG